ncbi:MAG: tRNA (N6-isopentenyl adenosine(37)-C2)-methylthiotransferase MiaB, partial [Christensenellales bacterium]
MEELIEKQDLSLSVPDREPDRQYYYIKKLREIISKMEIEKGAKLKCCVTTFGCQMNARDSEKLLGILLDAGYEETEDEKEADFVLYNTCTVRENANTRVYGRLGFLNTLKKKNKNMLIALCGCMMQEPEEVERVQTTYKFVDVVFGTHN